MLFVLDAAGVNAGSRVSDRASAGAFGTRSEAPAPHRRQMFNGSVDHRHMFSTARLEHRENAIRFQRKRLQTRPYHVTNEDSTAIVQTSPCPLDSP